LGSREASFDKKGRLELAVLTRKEGKEPLRTFRKREKSLSGPLGERNNGQKRPLGTQRGE